MIRERNVGESDKFIDVLTDELGVIEISVRGARKGTSKSSSATQIFAYSLFCVNKRGDRYYLNSSEPIKIFYGLRENIERLSLAMYFADIIKFTVSSEAPSGNILRLFLNSLHMLANEKRDEALIKAIFELRIMTKLGFMPSIAVCEDCAIYEAEKFYFILDAGILKCSNCASELNQYSRVYMLTPSTLKAMRHIVFSELDSLFSFNLKGDSLKLLGQITEEYLILHTDIRLKTLDFYKQLKA